MRRIIIGIVANVVFLVLIAPTCHAEATKNGDATPESAREAVKSKKRVKVQKIVKIGNVVDINGSIITYKSYNGKEEKVNADTFPGSLKVGDRIRVTTEAGRVTIVKDRTPVKIPIE